VGDHYTPRKYLRGFCETAKAGHIWTYDRLRKKRFKTAVENVAQENGFYHPDDEKALNEYVEIPANPILDKLRAGALVGEEDRQPLAVYIATLIYRVPHARAVALEHAPKALRETADEVYEVIVRAGAAGALRPEMVVRRLREVDDFVAKCRDGYPDQVMERVRSPWPAEMVVDAILGMHWRILTSTGPSYFLTSDNPAFFFHSKGLANSESEFSFPISTRQLLHGSWEVTRQRGGGADQPAAREGVQPAHGEPLHPLLVLPRVAGLDRHDRGQGAGPPPSGPHSLGGEACRGYLTLRSTRSCRTGSRKTSRSR
jgi:hypothetical protein